MMVMVMMMMVMVMMMILQSEEGIMIDGNAAMEHLLKRKDIHQKRIFVYGQSLGGAVSIYVAHQSQFTNKVRPRPPPFPPPLFSPFFSLFFLFLSCYLFYIITFFFLSSFVFFSHFLFFFFFYLAFVCVCFFVRFFFCLCLSCSLVFFFFCFATTTNYYRQNIPGNLITCAQIVTRESFISDVGNLICSAASFLPVFANWRGFVKFAACFQSVFQSEGSL